jgi:pimeloyl-ACP methyl ester carboxylesterase
MAGASGILRQQLVLLHGATASARVWDEVVPRLIVSHDVWIPTLAGHLGGPPLSVAPVDLVESIVDDVSRRLDEAGIERAHLVSNSLGGWLTLELARRGRACSVLAFAPAGAWNSAADLSRMERIFRAGAVLSR